MSFELGAATVVDDVARMRMISSAFRKTGKPVVLVPLTAGVHAGHLAMVRAAQAVRGAIVVVAMHEASAADKQLLSDARVDVVFVHPAPTGRTVVCAPDFALGDCEQLNRKLTAVIAQVGAVNPTDIVMGEKDYELLIAVNAAVRDLNIAARVQGVPTVRMPDGLAISVRNAQIAPEFRERASALSAALTAGAFAAEHGAQVVLDTVRQVLEAAGVQPDYVDVRGRDLGPAPEQGDARLCVAATFGGVQLKDNVGLPLGIGFKNIEAATAE